jgi:hypothetical protein
MTKARALATLADFDPTPPAFMVGLTSAQAISPSTYTKVAFDSVVFDTAGDWDATNKRFTPSVAGFYQVNTSININYTGQDNAQAIVVIYKNGSEYAWDTAVAGLGNRVSSSLSTVVEMNGTTDYVEVFVFSTASAGNSLQAQTSRCQFSGAMVRPA